MKRALPLAALPLLALAAALLASPPALAGGAWAHTTVGVGGYEIEAGWGTEPPVVGIRNTFVFEVSMPGEREGVKTGVRNAFASMDATARFGGAEKELDVSAAPTPGHYYSNVIPTRTGSYSVLFSGEIDGTPVDVDVSVEDVETTAVLDFPPRSGGGGSSSSGGDPGSDAVWAAIRQLQAGSGGGGIGGVGGPQESGQDSQPPRGGDPAAYDYAVVALSMAAAGIALAVVSMVRRR